MSGLRSSGGVVAFLGVVMGGCLPGVVLEQTPAGPQGPNAASSLCPTNHTVAASVTFDPRLTPDQFVASLEGCTTITGDFTLTRTTLTKLALPDLKTIGGVLHVEDNTKLTEIALPKLESASLVQIVDTTTDGVPLAKLDVGALQTGSIEIGRPPPSVGENPNGPPCDASVDPHALPDLDRVDLDAYVGDAQSHVVALGMSSLTTFNAPALASIGGELCFAQDDVLDLADGISALESVGALVLDHTGVVTLHAPNLAALGETPSFSVQSNDDLQLLDVSLSPWTVPASVGVQLDIVGNASLSQCNAEQVAFAVVDGTFPAGATLKVSGNQVHDAIATTDAELADIHDTCISGDLHVSGSVTSLAPLSNVVVVLGRLTVAHDDAIDAIALPSLTQVGKVLDIERTNATSIAMPSLRVIGDRFAPNVGTLLEEGVSINDNAALTSLDLGSAHFVTQAGFQVFDNPNLSTCDALATQNALCSQLTCYSAVFGDDNGPGCTDEIGTCTGGSRPDGPACPSFTSCGDGVVDAGETCDDGDRVPTDGCGANCSIETNFNCAGAPSSCTPCGGSTGVTCTPPAEGEGEGEGEGGEGEGEGGANVCTTFARDAGTFAIWHLDLPDPTAEASNGTAMVVSAPPPSTTTGRFAGGVAFAPTNSASVTPAAPPIGSTTLELWLELSAASTPGTIAVMQYSSGQSVTLSLEPGNKLSTTDGGPTLSTATQLSVGVYHLVALRCDTAATGNLTLFVDGAIAAQSAGAIKCAPAPGDVAQSLTFGNGFSGNLDEIRWSKLARTNAELETQCQ